MKISQGAGGIAIAALLHLTLGQGTGPCIEFGFSIEFDGECSYKNANMISALQQIFDESLCEHTLEDEIRFQLNLEVTATEEDVYQAVRDVCITAWDSAAKVPFENTHMKGDQFAQIYYNGGTSWNEEVQTSLEPGKATYILKEDAKIVNDFLRKSETTHVEWPGNLPNFNIGQCEINTAMCCWPKDRQADDDNGNCAKQYATNCYDKDPADNTDLCFVDLSRSPLANRLSGTGHIDFPNDDGRGEGAIHCHGFAWANDDYDFTSRFKANNLFFVSMYDHMYSRGYVRNIPGAPMCACVEKMPTVTRSDCTQIDVKERYKFVKDPLPNRITGKLLDIEIVFNSCQGRYNKDNDLHAYVARLVQEGKLNNDQRAELDKYIVGDGNCQDVSEHEILRKGHGRGFNVDTNTWFKVAGSGALYVPGVGREGFREYFKESEHQIVWRVCIYCVPSHQHIYYRRFTDVPDNMDLHGMLSNGWTDKYNKAGVDFKIYSTFEDAVDDTNPWKVYNFDLGRGFPNESGPSEVVRNQWRTLSRKSGQRTVAFYVMKKEGGIVALSDEILTGTDIGNPPVSGGVLEKDGTYYVTGEGFPGITNTYDKFYYVHEPTSGDVTVRTYVSSLQHKSPWTKAGLMVRQDLSPTSAHFFCYLSGKQGVVAQWRIGNGLHTPISKYGKNTGPYPTWLMITKMGDKFTCSMSNDGTVWKAVQKVTVVMTNDINVGMAIASTKRNELAEAVFEQYALDV